MADGLVNEIVDGQPALVAYMTSLDGDLTTKDKATAVIVRFADGTIRYGLLKPTQDQK